jgi:hypothetical protein
VRAPEPDSKGSVGVTEVRAEFERLGWGPIPNPDHDVGTDLFVQVRDERRHDLGLILGAQVKAGPSWFNETCRDDDGTLRGWWFRDKDRRHIDAWLGHTVPHVIVLRDLDDRISYWAHVQPDAVVSTGKGAKVFVPRANILAEEQRDALVAVAGTPRLPTAWEGSVWKAPELGAQKLLRHALISPRLVAPHPNVGYDNPLTPEQAVALVMQGRILDLDRFAGAHEDVPSLSDASSSPHWHWRFVGALGSRVVEDDPRPLVAMVPDAPSPAARAAAAAAGAAALVEGPCIEEATALLDRAIEDDDIEPVDHAWLLTQRARALREIGRLNDARADAEAARRIRESARDDVTASAIVGTTEMFLFNTAPLEELDLEMAIAGADTAASWWRTQTTSRGLTAIVERTFSVWARDKAVTVGGVDVAINQLYAASLSASHAGDQGAWRNLTTLTACEALLRLDRHADPESVCDGLTALRLAGGVKELALAVKQVAANGPAAAVTLAAGAIDLDRSTRTTARADLALLQHGGHLADHNTANRAVHWLLAVLQDPLAFTTRTTPSYILEDQLAVTLAAVLSAAGSEAQHRVAERVVTLEPHQAQLTAGSWSQVLLALPQQVWTEDAALRAGKAADQHHDVLRLPLLGVAARYDEAAATRLLAYAREGSLAALSSFGDVRQLPADAASAVTERLAGAADTIVADAHAGKFGIGGYDIGSALALLNAWHPGSARWEPLLQLLADDAVMPILKRNAMRTLASLADRVPSEIAERLLFIIARIAKREAPAAPNFLDDRRDAAGEAANLVVALGGLDADDSLDRLTDLVAGEREDRQWAAQVAGQVGRPEDVGILIVLAADGDPGVRAAAASGLAALVAKGQGGPAVRRALGQCISDPGAHVPEHIAATLRAAGGDVAEELLAILREHPSAHVRAYAIGLTI